MRLVDVGWKDFDFLRSLLTDKRIYKHIRKGERWSNDRISEFIQKNLSSKRGDDRYNYIVLNDKKEKVGVIGVRKKRKNYSLTAFFSPSFQGKGYFSESLKLLIRRLRRYHPELEAIYSQVHARNKKMNQIMKKRYPKTKTFYISGTKVNEYRIEIDF
jgi:RimJ/RimL family protein N-acetyltransferase